MDQFTRTWKFKDVVCNVEMFTELSSQYCPEALTTSVSETLLLFTTLWNEYCNSSIAFDTKDNFYRKFFNILWSEGEYYVDKIKKYREIRKMSNDQIIHEYTTISNVANNDNKVVESPLSEIIPYITTQATSSSKGNILTAISRALSEYRSNEVNNFVSKFSDLFLDIYGVDVIHYN